MVRGIERRRLVPDDTDRADVSGRLAALESVTQAIDGKLATLKAPGYDPTIMPYA
jgi:hypothetical protein